MFFNSFIQSRTAESILILPRYEIPTVLKVVMFLRYYSMKKKKKNKLTNKNPLCFSKQINIFKCLTVVIPIEAWMMTRCWQKCCL